MDRKQYGSKGGGNAHHRPTSATAASSGREHKGKSGGGGGGGGGKKRAIKVVYISNPMRVTTSAEGFRALVQELTGRHADPSKYGGAAGVGVGGSFSGSPAAELTSPGSTVETSSSSDAAAAAGGQVAQAAAYDDEDSFAPQLVDNRFSVCFSPPTFLYGAHNYDDDDDDDDEEV
ncbi:hypothetical protein ABZP36_013817 [Zizania latifolia]